MPNVFENIFKGIGSKADKVFDDIKAVFVKAAAEAPIIEGEISKITPEVTALATVVSPTLAGFVPGVVSFGESMLSVLAQGGTAAEQNFLNAGADQAALNAAKALIPAAHAIAAKK